MSVLFLIEVCDVYPDKKKSEVACEHQDIFQRTLVSLSESVSQSGLTLCDPMDCSLPASSVHGIFQVIFMGVGSHSLL